MSPAVLPVLVVLFAAAAAPAPPDTLVVCPAEFRAALAPWEAYRRGQGHELLAVEPPDTAAGVHKIVRRVAASGKLEYVVLIGDVPDGKTGDRSSQRITTPIDIVPARINTRWGSEPTIATDQTYADVDGDRMADLAVGRIPADSAAELSAVVRKVLRYERQTSQGTWQRRIDVVAGAGGFGPVADAVVRAAGRQVIEQSVPAGYAVGQTMTSDPAAALAAPGGLPQLVRRQLRDGCLAWVYLGHALPTELDRVPTPLGVRSLLAVGDVPRIRCGIRSPLAALIACYAGAVDAPEDCLGEELLLAEDGPVAVIAATRVTMPYGNSVYGCELLRACFEDRCPTVGQIVRLAQRRALAEAPDDPLRSSLDAVAKVLSPPPVDLAAERQEHVLMYQLLGDPLLALRRPDELRLESPHEVLAGGVLRVAGHTDVAGECLVELLPHGTGQEDGSVLAAVRQRVDAGPFEVAMRVPDETAGTVLVRAFVAGERQSAVGATRVVVRGEPTVRISQGGADRRLR